MVVSIMWVVHVEVVNVVYFCLFS